MADPPQWSCTVCTFLNHPAINECEMCTAPRPEQPEPPQPPNDDHLHPPNGGPDDRDRDQYDDLSHIDERDPYEPQPSPRDRLLRHDRDHSRDFRDHDRDLHNHSRHHSNGSGAHLGGGGRPSMPIVIDSDDEPLIVPRRPHRDLEPGGGLSPLPSPHNAAPQIRPPSQELLAHLSTLNGADVTPGLVPAIENFTRKHYKMEQWDRPSEDWLIHKADNDVVSRAIEAAVKSAELLRRVVDAGMRDINNPVGQQCGRCQASGKDTFLLEVEECGHAFCAACIRKYCLDLVNTLSCADTRCLDDDCDCSLPTGIIQQCMMPKEFQRYEKATLDAFLKQAGDIVACPAAGCSEVVTLEKRTGVKVPDKITVTGMDGKPISAESWLHYNQNRLRCRACNLEFCALCKAEPYHTGFTCQQFEEYGSSKHCRFCEAQLTPANTAPPTGHMALDVCCTDSDCMERRPMSCNKILPCGHLCRGISDEKECLPCLEEDCKDHKLPQSGSDFCNICFCEGLAQAPCIMQKCGHVFHRHCVVQKLEKNWPGVRITFGFMKCPLCPELIEHESLVKELAPYKKLYDKIKEKSLFRLKVDGMEKDPKLIDPNSRWFNKPLEYAMNSFAYYRCFKCKNEYFGGRRDCEQNADAEKRPDDEFVCFECADLRMAPCTKPNHREYHTYKCRFCCSVAVWFCWGTTHFCDACHSDRPWERVKWSRDKFKLCRGKEYCPLKVDHAPNGAEPECEQSLGCAMCMDEARKQQDEHRKEKEIGDRLDGKLPPPSQNNGASANQGKSSNAGRKHRRDQSRKKKNRRVFGIQF